MRVLGIDPGSERTGWGVVTRDGGRLVCLGAGVLRPRGDGLAARLASLRGLVAAVVAEQRPGEVAVEGVFHARNARSALVLGQARGAVLVALADAGHEPHAYAPAMVKRVVTGSGRAEKPQIGRAIGAILGVEGLAADAADALAIAVCHALAGQARRLLKAGT